ncbi:replication protein a 70 kda dna-binding subunit [Stylonychia lemnae]|uniref:Replication protein a 70 kDa dna-binding subunit n=1 Tax=Stylonychia lemnae TaxID=5949 RepID=A0A078A800_STYLE|nr:replication protein a 70 kda dna-binding subunit [Stylonychia lemnae]|eukprot:CDW78370.1 replication protein a 70 kda dna-binding subunit [Stylonychia lemnae]
MDLALANKFDNILKENKVYTFANAEVKLSNVKYTSIKNEYCLNFNHNADIQEADDDESIQSQAFNFFNIKELLNQCGQKTVDFIGVAHSCMPAKEKQLKSGVTKSQRTVYLADESNLTIALCIWGDFANKFDLGPDEHPIVAIKRAQLSEFGGKSINSNEDSQIMINPKHKRTDQLQSWYRYLQDPSDLKCITMSKDKQDFPEEKKVVQFDNQRLIGEIMEALTCVLISGFQKMMIRLITWLALMRTVKEKSLKKVLDGDANTVIEHIKLATLHICQVLNLLMHLMLTSQIFISKKALLQWAYQQISLKILKIKETFKQLMIHFRIGNLENLG